MLALANMAPGGVMLAESMYATAESATGPGGDNYATLRRPPDSLKAWDLGAEGDATGAGVGTINGGEVVSADVLNMYAAVTKSKVCWPRHRRARLHSRSQCHRAIQPRVSLSHTATPPHRHTATRMPVCSRTRRSVHCYACVRIHVLRYALARPRAYRWLTSTPGLPLTHRHRQPTPRENTSTATAPMASENLYATVDDTARAHVSVPP